MAQLATERDETCKSRPDPACKVDKDVEFNPWANSQNPCLLLPGKPWHLPANK